MGIIHCHGDMISHKGENVNGKEKGPRMGPWVGKRIPLDAVLGSKGIRSEVIEILTQSSMVLLIHLGGQCL